MYNVHAVIRHNQRVIPVLKTTKISKPLTVDSHMNITLQSILLKDNSDAQDRERSYALAKREAGHLISNQMGASCSEQFPGIPRRRRVVLVLLSNADLIRSNSSDSLLSQFRRCWQKEKVDVCSLNIGFHVGLHTVDSKHGFHVKIYTAAELQKPENPISDRMGRSCSDADHPTSARIGASSCQLDAEDRKRSYALAKREAENPISDRMGASRSDAEEDKQSMQQTNCSHRTMTEMQNCVRSFNTSNGEFYVLLIV
jgi:hypothetical protein